MKPPPALANLEPCVHELGHEEFHYLWTQGEDDGEWGVTVFEWDEGRDDAMARAHFEVSGPMQPEEVHVVMYLLDHFGGIPDLGKLRELR